MYSVSNLNFRQSNGNQIINYYLIFDKKFSIVRLDELVEVSHDEVIELVKGAPIVMFTHEPYNNEHLIIGKIYK